jgi:lipopolysaccharide export system permease protein
MTIEDFALRAEIMSAMDTPELMAFIDEQRLSGSGRVKEFEVELHSRTSNAFAIIILTLIGVTIASRKIRGGTGVHLLLAVVLGFVYVFISKVTAVSAVTIGVPVVIAVWIPNIFFMILSVFLYRKAQK